MRSSGVRVVGAPGKSEAEEADVAEDADVVVDADMVEGEGSSGPDGGRPPSARRSRRPKASRRRRRPGGSPEVRRRRKAFATVSVVAVLGLAGTIGFGLAWAGQHAQQEGEAQARSTAKTFLTSLTNFTAKSVDADFSAITNMATGDFASQANKFFNSSIRQELETALASSRGQIRSLYVETYSGSQASVYAVIDQLYVNNKISSPQSDVLRVVVNLSQLPSGWKISDVTVLTGPSLASGATSSAGSSTSTSSSSSTTSTTAPAG